MNNLKFILQKSCKQFSEKIAIHVPNDKGYNYSYLSDAWQFYASLFKKEAIENQKRIGVLLASKKSNIKAIGGVLYADNVYIPLDIDSPLERNLNIINDNQLHAIIIEKELWLEYKSNFENYRIVKSQEHLLIIFKTAYPIDSTLDQNLALILNTSGSTGKPKGVMLSHENTMSFVKWANNSLSLSSMDNIISLAPFQFDLSLFDLFLNFLNGSSLLLTESADIKNPRLIAYFIDKYKISVIYATPTLLGALAIFGKLKKFQHSTLRYILFAGEIFPIGKLKLLKRLWPEPKYLNLYGPTETNVCTWFTLPDDIENQQDAFPIGVDCAHVKTKIKDNLNQGELLVSGISVSKGYFNRPGLNSEKFHTDSMGICWYKTGDLVRKDKIGNYIFIGRKDRMIKRRGYRIELDEIEQCIQKNENLEQVAIIASEDQESNIQIICFFSLKSEKSTHFIIQDLREFCKSKLPKYMYPDKFQQLDEIQLSTNHKIDYRALENITL